MSAVPNWYIYWLLSGVITVLLMFVVAEELAERLGFWFAHALILPFLVVGWWLFDKRWGGEVRGAMLSVLEPESTAGNKLALGLGLGGIVLLGVILELAY